MIFFSICTRTPFIKGHVESEKLLQIWNEKFTLLYLSFCIYLMIFSHIILPKMSTHFFNDFNSTKTITVPLQYILTISLATTSTYRFHVDGRV